MLRTCLGSFLRTTTWRPTCILLGSTVVNICLIFLDHTHLGLNSKGKCSLLSVKIKKICWKLQKFKNILRTFWGSFWQKFKNIEAEPLFQCSYKKNWVYPLGHTPSLWPHPFSKNIFLKMYAFWYYDDFLKFWRKKILFFL